MRLVQIAEQRLVAVRRLINQGPDQLLMCGPRGRRVSKRPRGPSPAAQAGVDSPVPRGYEPDTSAVAGASATGVPGSVAG